ncbi:MAG: T9SS type A sorting domain-containing protein [Bacteroidetes bacterium]|nr:T9SS type A sorting domain-containing protein [Bacteroidota bacterium]
MNRPTAIKTVIALAAALAASAAWPQQPFDLDTTFRFNAGSVGIGSIFPLADGDVIVSGQITFPGEWPSEHSGARIHADGSRNTEFQYGYMGGKITPWQDGYYCGNGQGIRRFHINGAIDTAYKPMYQIPYFNMAQGGDYYVFPDGRVLVSGSHYLQDSIRGFVGEYGLIWFTNQGYLDTTRIHRRTNAAIFHLFPLPDGKFICSGFSWNFDGHELASTAFRVMPDGALDTTFHGPPGYVDIMAMLPLPNGKLLISGGPSWLDNGDTVNLMRLMPDGSRDLTFHSPIVRNFNPVLGHSLNEIILSITPFGEDAYIITGSFTELEGQPRGGIAAIDTAGNLLTSIFINPGCGGYQMPEVTEPWGWADAITGLVQTSTGDFYIYGAYHGYDDGSGTDGSSQRLISRLYGLNVGISEHGAHAEPLQIAPNPSAGSTVLSVGTPPPKGRLTIHDASGRVVLQTAWPEGGSSYTLEAGALAPGVYVVRVASSTSTSASASTLYSGKLIILP